MLACRPMLSLAVAVIAGAIVSRLYPEVEACLGYGAVLFCLFAAWFVLTPRREPPNANSIPDGYGRHILPQPGFAARRGLNRFILLLGLLFLLIGVYRQGRWKQQLSPERLPEKRWFDANLRALAPSREHAGQDGVWRVPALLLTVDGEAADAIPVRLSGPAGTDFRRGDMIQTRVRRETVFPPSHPRAFDTRFWLERDGLAASLVVAASRRSGEASYVVIAVDEPSLFIRVRRLVDAVRARAIAATLEWGGDNGGMLAAMLYGYRKDVGAELRDAFRRVGIGHVLAISGLHVGLVVGLLWWASGLAGWSSRWRALACLVLSVFYLGLSGGQVAASRATFMAIIHLAGIAWGRRSDMLNSLGAAAFFLTLANPSTPFDVSFQLSFTAVVFIHLALRRDADRDRRRDEAGHGQSRSAWRVRLARELESLVRLSISTWIGLFPIIALVFNQVNLVGLPINILIIPLMSAVLACGLLLPWLGWIPGVSWLLRLPGNFLAWIALEADRLPFSSLSAHAPTAGWVAVFYLFILMFLLAGMIISFPVRKWWRRGWGAAIAVALVGMVSSMASLPPPAEGRIAVLPGRGFGVVAAESGEGGIALLGAFARGGLNEAGWLHYLRRGGEVGVVAMGGTVEEDLKPLAYHYPVRDFAAVAPVDKEETRFGWRPVAGAPGVEYAVSRDARGRVVWLAVRTGGRSVCVGPRLALAQLGWRLEHKVAGYDASLMCLGFSDKEWAFPIPQQPSGRVALQGRYKGTLPEGWFEKRRYGVLRIEEGITGFDGSEWVAVFP